MKKQKKNMSIDDLAVIVSAGFESTATKEGLGRLEKRISSLEDGQEQIKLKLDNVAYRFELV